MTDKERLREAYGLLAEAMLLARLPASVRQALGFIRRRRAGKPVSAEEVQAFLEQNNIASPIEEE